MTATTSPAVGRDKCLTALTHLLGDTRVLTDGRKISRYLRDFSWYSPILDNAFADTTVDAVVRPSSVEELETVVSIAARHRVPITMRGAGTGNYGQSLPLQRGIVVDVKGVAGILETSPGRVAVLPGTVMKDIEHAVADSGQQLAIMPSTFRVATASGFICGGSGGLGAAAYGDLWSNNVHAVELITVEEKPRRIRLEGDDVNVVLHTYGTVGVVTRVELRLVQKRQYTSTIALFEEFTACAQFGWDLVNSDVHCRLVSLQQSPIGAMFTPIADAIPAAKHVALLWTDSADDATLQSMLATAGGTAVTWPENAKDITQFPYSHTILWSRRAHPDSSWLQCEYAADDRAAFLRQVEQIGERYAGTFLQHIEINKSATGGIRCMGIPPVVGLPNHESALDGLLAFCTGIGVSVLNPHSYVVDEGGFVGDTGKVIALKAESDPHHILNPGKLGMSFFEQRAEADAATTVDFRAPEQLSD